MHWNLSFFFFPRSLRDQAYAQTNHRKRRLSGLATLVHATHTTLKSEKHSSRAFSTVVSFRISRMEQQQPNRPRLKHSSGVLIIPLRRLSMNGPFDLHICFLCGQPSDLSPTLSDACAKYLAWLCFSWFSCRRVSTFLSVLRSKCYFHHCYLYHCQPSSQTCTCSVHGRDRTGKKKRPSGRPVDRLPFSLSAAFLSGPCLCPTPKLET